MAISFDKALGIHPQALAVRSQRTQLLATNLAHADTPNYKARDLDFRAILNNEQNGTMRMHATSSKHLQAGQQNEMYGQTLYRIPSQPSLDGNSVDTQLEKAEFTQNAVQYQATLRFISGRFQGMLTALRGE